MTDSDAAAEIDRLCAPAGPWLHLLDGAPADARQLGWLLAERGAVTRLLRGQCMRTGYGLFDEFGAALQLPGDPVEDWAELAAPLAELDWLARRPGATAPADGHVLLVVAASLTLVAEPAEFAAFCQTLSAVAQRRSAEVEVGTPVPLHVVLADDSVGLAALRVRLRATGVAFREMTGWTPQEPAVVRERGARSGYVAGAPLDGELDAAAIAALAELPEVLEIRRATEVFRAAETIQTPVYGAVLDRFERVDEVIDRLAAAVAAAGAQVQVMSDIEAARTPRQREFLAASVQLWPTADVVEPVLEPAEGPVVEEAEGSVVDQAAVAVVAPAAAERADTEPVAVETNPAPPAAGEVAQRPFSGPAGAEERGAQFEIVAANLEWEFQTGAAEPDAVDAAVLAAAEPDGQVLGLWRCWCHDPRRERWIRVVLGVAVDAAAADPVRRLLVDTLEAAGAARCCVEVVAAADSGSVVSAGSESSASDSADVDSG